MVREPSDGTGHESGDQISFLRRAVFMLVLVCNRAVFEALGFFGRHCHHSEVGVGHAGPISWTI